MDHILIKNVLLPNCKRDNERGVNSSNNNNNRCRDLIYYHIHKLSIHSTQVVYGNHHGDEEDTQDGDDVSSSKQLDTRHVIERIRTYTQINSVQWMLKHHHFNLLKYKLLHKVHGDDEDDGGDLQPGVIKFKYLTKVKDKLLLDLLFQRYQEPIQQNIDTYLNEVENQLDGEYENTKMDIIRLSVANDNIHLFNILINRQQQNRRNQELKKRQEELKQEPEQVLLGGDTTTPIEEEKIELPESIVETVMRYKVSNELVERVFEMVNWETQKVNINFLNCLSNDFQESASRMINLFFEVVLPRINSARGDLSYSPLIFYKCNERVYHMVMDIIKYTLMGSSSIISYIVQSFYQRIELVKSKKMYNNLVAIIDWLNIEKATTLNQNIYHTLKQFNFNINSSNNNNNNNNNISNNNNINNINNINNSNINNIYNSNNNNNNSNLFNSNNNIYTHNYNDDEEEDNEILNFARVLELIYQLGEGSKYFSGFEFEMFIKKRFIKEVVCETYSECMELVLYILDYETRRYLGSNLIVFDQLCKYGTLQQVQNAHQIIGKGRQCIGRVSFHAMDNACKQGKLDIVRFLHLERDEQCSQDVFSKIVSKEVTEYLITHKPTLKQYLTRQQALESLNIDVLEYVISLKGTIKSDRIVFSRMIIENLLATRNNHYIMKFVDILNRVGDLTDESCYHILCESSRLGRIELVQHFCQLFKDVAVCTPSYIKWNVLDVAYLNGHMDVVEYFININHLKVELGEETFKTLGRLGKFYHLQLLKPYIHLDNFKVVYSNAIRHSNRDIIDMHPVVMDLVQEIDVIRSLDMGHIYPMYFYFKNKTQPVTQPTLRKLFQQCLLNGRISAARFIYPKLEMDSNNAILTEKQVHHLIWKGFISVIDYIHSIGLIKKELVESFDFPYIHHPINKSLRYYLEVEKEYKINTQSNTTGLPPKNCSHNSGQPVKSIHIYTSASIKHQNEDRNVLNNKEPISQVFSNKLLLSKILEMTKLCMPNNRWVNLYNKKEIVSPRIMVQEIKRDNVTLSKETFWKYLCSTSMVFDVLIQNHSYYLDDNEDDIVNVIKNGSIKYLKRLLKRGVYTEEHIKLAAIECLTTNCYQDFIHFVHFNYPNIRHDRRDFKNVNKIFERYYPNGIQVPFPVDKDSYYHTVLDSYYTIKSSKEEEDDNFIGVEPSIVKYYIDNEIKEGKLSIEKYKIRYMVWYIIHNHPLHIPKDKVWGFCESGYSMFTVLRWYHWSGIPIDYHTKVDTHCYIQTTKQLEAILFLSKNNDFSTLFQIPVDADGNNDPDLIDYGLLRYLIKTYPDQAIPTNFHLEHNEMEFVKDIYYRYDHLVREQSHLIHSGPEEYYRFNLYLGLLPHLVEYNTFNENVFVSIQWFIEKGLHFNLPSINLSHGYRINKILIDRVPPETLIHYEFHFSDPMLTIDKDYAAFLLAKIPKDHPDYQTTTVFLINNVVAQNDLELFKFIYGKSNKIELWHTNSITNYLLCDIVWMIALNRAGSTRLLEFLVDEVVVLGLNSLGLFKSLFSCITVLGLKAINPIISKSRVVLKMSIINSMFLGNVPVLKYLVKQYNLDKQYNTHNSHSVNGNNGHNISNNSIEQDMVEVMQSSKTIKLFKCGSTIVQPSTFRQIIDTLPEELVNIYVLIIFKNRIVQLNQIICESTTLFSRVKLQLVEEVTKFSNLLYNTAEIDLYYRYGLINTTQLRNIVDVIKMGGVDVKITSGIKTMQHIRRILLKRKQDE